MSANNGKIWKGVLAGAAGGLIASFAMNQFQALLSKAEKELSDEPEGEQSEGSGEDATVKTAEAISKHVFEHDLTKDEKKWAGPAVHYGFGTMMGAVYGGLAATTPAATAGFGTAWGTAVWLGADEVTVPALGLSPRPSETPASSHVKALAAHLVYGVVTESVRRGISRAS